jgi:hypothetical protein
MSQPRVYKQSHLRILTGKIAYINIHLAIPPQLISSHLIPHHPRLTFILTSLDFSTQHASTNLANNRRLIQPRLPLHLLALSRGDRVVATARNASTRLTHLQALGASVLDLDVTVPQPEINSIVAQAIKVYGHIDVLVNSAGYIEAGMVKELG